MGLALPFPHWVTSLTEQNSRSRSGLKSPFPSVTVKVFKAAGGVGVGERVDGGFDGGVDGGFGVGLDVGGGVGSVDGGGAWV